MKKKLYRKQLDQRGSRIRGEGYVQVEADTTTNKITTTTSTTTTNKRVNSVDSSVHRDNITPEVTLPNVDVLMSAIKVSPNKFSQQTPMTSRRENNQGHNSTNTDISINRSIRDVTEHSDLRGDIAPVLGAESRYLWPASLPDSQYHSDSLSTCSQETFISDGVDDVIDDKTSSVDMTSSGDSHAHLTLPELMEIPALKYDNSNQERSTFEDHSNFLQPVTYPNLGYQGDGEVCRSRSVEVKVGRNNNLYPYADKRGATWEQENGCYVRYSLCGSSGSYDKFHDDVEDQICPHSSSSSTDGKTKSSITGSVGGRKSSSSRRRRKRVQTPVQRSAANMRERRRMCHLNVAFDHLKEHLPNVKDKKKLSRIQTLKAAIYYIHLLRDSLN